MQYPSTFGRLKTEHSIEFAQNEIRKYLGYIGIAKPLIALSFNAAHNSASCSFEFQGKLYEFKSTTQKNCRLNMHAIARAMEFKARLHLMQIERFDTSMSPYIKLGASQEYKQTPAAPPQHSGSAYAILGISELASNEELLLCYKRMVKGHHPDLATSPEAKETFTRMLAEINGAWAKIKAERGIQ